MMMYIVTDFVIAIVKILLLILVIVTFILAQREKNAFRFRTRIKSCFFNFWHSTLAFPGSKLFAENPWRVSFSYDGTFLG